MTMYTNRNLQHLIDRVEADVEKNRKEPHAPVAGCCHVLPMRETLPNGNDASWLTLQGNGFAIRLFESGEWEFVATDKEAAGGVQLTGES